MSLRMDFAAQRGTTFDDRALLYDQYGSTETIVNINVSDVSPSTVYMANTNLNYVVQGTYGITGTNSVVKVGTGTLTFKNSNTYSGGTSLTGGGTISIHGGSALGTGDIAVGTGTLDFAGASSYTLTNAIANATSMTMSVTNAAPVTVSGGINGNGALTKTGSGTLILSANNIYAGATAISSGTLQLGNGGTTGTLGTSVADITDNGTLAVNRSDDVSLALKVTGTGGLSQMGSGILSLTANNDYAGITRITGGALSVGNGGTFGTLGTGDVQDNAELGFNRSNLMTVANNISGTGRVTNAGAGTTILTGSNSYSGITWIKSGAIQVGNGGTSGTLGTGDVTDSGILAFNRSDSLEVANNISGGGAILKGGSGTTILTGTNSYQDYTSINAGTLQIGNGGITGSLGTGSVTNNTALVFNRSNSMTVANTITGSGTLAQNGTGTSILTGSNDYSGATTISSGTLQIGNAGATGSLGTGSVTNNAALVFNRNNTMTVANKVSGSGTLAQVGSGTTILTAGNDYTGITTISSGTLQIGNNGSVGSLGSGAVTNNASLVFNRTDSHTVANKVSGSGALVQNGSGTTILTGSNDYSGATTISNGTLQIGNGGLTGDIGTGSVTDNAALVFNRSNAVSYAGSISGTGSLAQSGAGTTTLTGSNSYGGGTTISSGTLQIGNGGTTGTLGAGGVANSASLAFNRSNTMTVTNAISGVGSVRQAGNGRTILTGSSSYTGATLVEDGELTVNGSIGGSAVTVSSGAILSGSGSVKTISGAGTVSPGNSPGILEAVSVDPSAGTDFNFEFTQIGSPTYSNATASGNDVLRLTSGTAPFAQAMTSSNTANIFLNVASVNDGDMFRGAWYTDKSSSFISSIESASYVYYVKGDGNGTYLFNGVSYYSLAQYNLNTSNNIQFTVSSVSDTAYFTESPTSGFVTQFSAATTMIPEPTAAGTFIMALAAAALRRRIIG